MGKVITIKNNKGGVGKSWLTLQLAHIIALILEDKKVLILTSDSQNNILLYANISVPVVSGLEDHVLKGDGDIIALRENLYYIPLIKNNFTKKFREKLRITIDEFKKEYDYILIDSVPVLNIDQDFVELSDKVVIPTFLDAATTEGITKLMGE
ncbi:ParA family protein, partial [Cetobacterium sp.]|uniref:ParA family protein n=1 Tax=Cetobacterium sp. TaxID=2071632 RepID=UPI003F3F51A4